MSLVSEEVLNKALDAEKKKEEEEKLFAEDQWKINNLLDKLEGLISSNDIKSSEALINCYLNYRQEEVLIIHFTQNHLQALINQILTLS